MILIILDFLRMPEKPNRGKFGTIVKRLFVLFHLLMILLLAITYVSGLGVTIAESETEQFSQAIDVNIKYGVILAFWVLGDCILGLLVMFTRPK